MTINIPIALLRIGHNALGAIHPMRIGTYWHLIDWGRVHRIVRNLQGRIVKAVQEKQVRIQKSLQRLLTHSTSAKLLAIRRVKRSRFYFVLLREYQ